MPSHQPSPMIATGAAALSGLVRLRGVPWATLQYLCSAEIAQEYDEHFAHNGLFEFDEQVLARHLTRPGVVVDLGCGTGRSLVPLLRRGLRGLGVDLSAHMLRITAEKAGRENLPVMLLQANLVELDCLRTASADYCISMFSTLGMIQGHDNRRRALAHAYRILKPGGLFIVHVHNLWYSFFDDHGARWLARHLLESLVRREVERGDKSFPYRGIPDMFLHTYTRGELVRSLREARFQLKDLIPLTATRRRRLSHSWLLGGFRANGWIAVCQKVS